MNTITIIGNLGSDAETKKTPSGQTVHTFSIASKSKVGKEDVALWFRVAVWGDRYEKMIPYLKTGASLIVIGELNPPRLYTNKQGQPAVSLEITGEVLKFNPSKPAKKEGDGLPF